MKAPTSTHLPVTASICIFHFALCIDPRFLMSDSTPKNSLEEFRAERRRERWKAFLNPLITMASIVGSVALVMYMIKICSERFSPAP